MHIFFLIFLLFFVPILFDNVYSDLLIEVDKDVILSYSDTATITIDLDYVPKNNVVIVQVFDSRGSQFMIREASVDNNGLFKIEFQGYREPVLGGIYDVVVTGMNEKNETVKDIGYFSMGVKPEENYESGGCLIATATFGTELAFEVQLLREIRDNAVLNTDSGTLFMTGFNTFYYSFAPTIADWERQNLMFKEIIKIMITPLLTSLLILNYVDINSEYDLLGYGIGIILLNIGIYFATPAIIFLKIYNYSSINFQKRKHLT
tara:strand:- start:5689 stop:6474 length:786 start_codon:yes stop_codon:yes gene_type:complete